MDDTSTRKANGIARGESGTTTGDGTALTVTLGYKPKRVTLINLTDAIRIEKIDGMTDAQTLQTVTAGTTTVQTGSQIVLNDRGFVASAAVNANGKSLVWYTE